jgi:hypothetical protein
MKREKIDRLKNLRQSYEEDKLKAYSGYWDKKIDKNKLLDKLDDLNLDYSKRYERLLDGND